MGLFNRNKDVQADGAVEKDYWKALEKGASAYKKKAIEKFEEYNQANPKWQGYFLLFLKYYLGSTEEAKEPEKYYDWGLEPDAKKAGDYRAQAIELAKSASEEESAFVERFFDILDKSTVNASFIKLTECREFVRRTAMAALLTYYFQNPVICPGSRDDGFFWSEVFCHTPAIDGSWMFHHFYFCNEQSKGMDYSLRYWKVQFQRAERYRSGSDSFWGDKTENSCELYKYCFIRQMLVEDEGPYYDKYVNEIYNTDTEEGYIDILYNDAVRGKINAAMSMLMDYLDDEDGSEKLFALDDRKKGAIDSLYVEADLSKNKFALKILKRLAGNRIKEKTEE